MVKQYNTRLYHSKSIEIIFTDSQRKPRQNPLLPLLPSIHRATSLKILWVTFTNHLSVSWHVSSVTSSCARYYVHTECVTNRYKNIQGCEHHQSLLCIYRMVAIHVGFWQTTRWSFSPSLCAKPSMSAGTVRFDRTYWSSKRSSYYRILSNDNRVLYNLIPPEYDSCYDLRDRSHNRQLIPRNTHLFNKNFIICLLYKDCYWTKLYNVSLCFNDELRFVNLYQTNRFYEWMNATLKSLNNNIKLTWDS